MENQFLFENAIVLTIGTIFFVIVYIVLTVRVSNSLLLKRQINNYEDSDRIIMSSIIFTFLINLSSVITPTYQILQQFKYTHFKRDFTLQILFQVSYFILIATIYSIVGLIIVNIASKLFSRKSEAIADQQTEISYGIFYGLFLIGTALVFKEHLNMLLSAIIQTNSIPIFN